MDYTVSFTAQNFSSHVGAEPAPMDPVTGSFIFSWDNSLGFSSAILRSFTASFGSYTPAYDEIDGYFADTGHFIIGGLDGDGPNNIFAGTDDFMISGDIHSLLVSFMAYSNSGQQDPTVFQSTDVTMSISSLSSVPEPSTFGLLALGVLGVFGYCRFRRT